METITTELNMGLIQKEVNDFFNKVVTDTVKYRRKEGVVRHDFLQNLINDNIASEEKGFGPAHSYEEITAHCMTFFLDGYNTSSIALGFVLYELSMNKDCQDKCREELFSQASKIEELDYDKILKLDYLYRTILEALRLHPPVPVMTKKCTKSTILKCMDESCEIEKGTGVAIPVLSLHTDPEYFPDPMRFDPDRHVKEVMDTRPHYAFLPFGDGPRICLGIKFAQVVLNIALASIIMNFEILPNDPNAKVEQDPCSSFLYQAKGGTWVKFKKLRM